MKKSKSLFEALTALKAVTQTLFKKMPVLFLVVVICPQGGQLHIY